MFSVAPLGRRWLIASTSIDTPSVSDSRMNSWRHSVHVCPVSVRKLIAASHSSCVGSISLIAACRCLTTTAMISRSRGFDVGAHAGVDHFDGGGLLEVRVFLERPAYVRVTHHRYLVVARRRLRLSRGMFCRVLRAHDAQIFRFTPLGWADRPRKHARSGRGSPHVPAGADSSKDWPGPDRPRDRCRSRASRGSFRARRAPTRPARSYRPRAGSSVPSTSASCLTTSGMLGAL